MKKIIAQIACATILSMGIITNTAICADKEVKAEITQGYPNIAAEGKTLEKQIASVIKAVKTLEKKAKAFNKIANKELTKGTGNHEELDANITSNNFISIQKYFENTKKAVTAIRSFKSKNTIGVAISKTYNVDNTRLNNAIEIFNKLSTISMSDKAKKAAVSFHSALHSFLTSLDSIAIDKINNNSTTGSIGQLEVANQFFENFKAKLNEMKNYNTPEFRLQPETWTNKNQNSTVSTAKTKSAAKISNKAPLNAGRNRSLPVRRNPR